MAVIAPRSAPPRSTPECAAIDQQVDHLSTCRPDVTLLLDRDWVIREATLCEAASGEQPQPWLGRPWVETLPGNAGDQVLRMLRDATSAGVSASGPVAQRFPSGLELPIEYTTVRLGRRGNLMAVGKCVQAVMSLQANLLAAQRGREQDYWRLREVETRYRLLFDTTYDAVVMLDADTLRIAEVNPAALRAFGFSAGHDLLAEFALPDREAAYKMLHRVRDHGRVPGILVHIGAAARAWTLRASLVQTDQGGAFLLQFAKVGAGATPDVNSPVAADPFIDRLPDGFLIMDADGVVRRANPAFVDFTQRNAEAAVLGHNLSHWMHQQGADLPALLAQVNRYGAVELFATTLQGDLGTPCPVEISAAAHVEGEAPGIAMIVRPVRPGAPSPGAAATPLMSRSGKVPMNQLVQEATEVVERKCIEAALARSNGNRSLAAALLGLSRQSLYVKLNRYGFRRDDESDPEAQM